MNNPDCELVSGLIWLTLAGSFISRASILLIRVVILASAVMGDSRDRSPPLEAIDCKFLGFFEAGSHCRFSQLNPQINPNPGSHPSARTLPDTWSLKGFSFDNLSYRRESDTDAISPQYDEGTELGDL